MNVLRQVLHHGRRNLFRPYSSATNLVKVDVDPDSGFATVSMAKPPVNSLSLELLTSLYETFDKLEKEKCPGMILTSESPTVFSAGLDILEMYKPKMDRARQFWSTLQETWMKLYSAPYPTIAAINGHSPAGGCLLAMSCEYRVMVSPKYTIGLNETQLGIVAPFWFQLVMKNVIGTRQAELALITGKLFPAEEAHKIGLVDELVSNKEEAIKRAEDFLEQQSYLPPMARMLIKTHYRKDTVDWLIKNREEDINTFLKFIQMPKVQQGLEMYMATLKSK